MKLLEDLRAEHVLIEAVVGSLFAYAGERGRGEGDAGDGEGYLRFFRRFAGSYHHGREEEVLFPALVGTEVPGDRGPLAALLHAHGAMGHMLEELAAELRGGGGEGGRAGTRLIALARRYGEALLHHIDAESSVLFPESEIRFRRKSVMELPQREPTVEEAAARDEGAALVERRPPVVIGEIFRGDGCTACADYGTRCEGIEREWWSEHEWDDMFERSGDG